MNGNKITEEEIKNHKKIISTKYKQIKKLRQIKNKKTYLIKLKISDELKTQYEKDIQDLKTQIKDIFLYLKRLKSAVYYINNRKEEVVPRNKENSFIYQMFKKTTKEMTLEERRMYNKIKKNQSRKKFV